MLDIFSRLTLRSQQSLGRYAVKSAMTPIFWICAVVSPSFIAGSYLTQGTFLSYLFGVVAVIPAIVACVGFVYFALKDPDRLQSEEHREATRAFDISESKGGKLKLTASDLVNIINPYASPPKQITSVNDDEATDATEGGDND